VDGVLFPVPVSPLIAAAPEWSCGYDAVNNQVQWMGTIGPDNGNLTEAAAANEVVITFRVSVNASVNQVQNQGSARTDVDNDANFVEEMVLGTSLTSSNVVAWARTSADPGQQVIATNTLPATGFAPNVVTDMSNVPLQTYIATDGVTVEIPSLNIKIPVVGVPKKDGTWNVSWLGNQAGWLEGSAFPSWSGNSVLTGHVYLSNGLPGPFISLGRLKYGDKIIIHAYGQKYTFEVRTNQVVEPNDKSAMKHEEKAWLTLITCKEYDEKTNTYRKRIVVRAVLINVTGE
jgi:LPXTG-site transpeptidase (sortase) family protein